MKWPSDTKNCHLNLVVINVYKKCVQEKLKQRKKQVGKNRNLGLLVICDTLCKAMFLQEEAEIISQLFVAFSATYFFKKKRRGALNFWGVW